MRRTSGSVRGLAGACVGLALAGGVPACGRSEHGGSQEDAGASSRDWTYGSPTWSVLSSPASDGTHLFVVMGEREEAKPSRLAQDFATALGPEPYSVRRVVLVALDLAGAELWAHDICPGQPGPPSGPAVTLDGDAVVACSGVAYRVDASSGLEKASAPLPGEGNFALADDGCMAFLAPNRATVADDAGRAFESAAELFYLEADLATRWTKVVGFTTGGDLAQATRLSPFAAPLFDARGNVYAPCDTCNGDAGHAPTSGDRSAFFRFDAMTGEATALVELDPGPTTFGMSAGGREDRVYFTANSWLYTASGDGASIRTSLSSDTFLVADEGAVFLSPPGGPPAIQLGERQIVYEAPSTITLPGGPRALGEGAVLLSDGRWIDMHGNVTDAVEELEPASAPLLLDDLFVARTKDQRLRGTVGGPARAVAPWPLLAGDERSARSMR